MSTDNSKLLISLAPPADLALRRAGRLLTMVRELHTGADPTGEKASRTPGGVAVRVVAALTSFRSKFGYWPSVVEVEAESIAALATHYLIPFVGCGGDVFDYGAEGGGELADAQQDAQAWLGWATASA